jgi:hypothetical protein
MTVQQLIKHLQKMPPRSLVVMSKDSEGNDFTPLAALGTCKYIEANSWSGTIVSDEDEEDGKSSICLWPTY